MFANKSLMLLIVLLALMGCAPESRGVTHDALTHQSRVNRPGMLDVEATYRGIHSDGILLPRACHRGRKALLFIGPPVTEQHLGRLRALGVEVLVGNYDTQAVGNRQVLLDHHAPLPVLYHEVTHLGQARGHHTGSLDLEEGAMVVEVKTLMASGWTDQQLRDLSQNNSRVPQVVYDWIRKNGPDLTGQPSDIETCYLWGMRNRLPSHELHFP